VHIWSKRLLTAHDLDMRCSHFRWYEAAAPFSLAAHSALNARFTKLYTDLPAIQAVLVGTAEIRSLNPYDGVPSNLHISTDNYNV
jgi:hypothetical protein